LGRNEVLSTKGKARKSVEVFSNHVGRWVVGVFYPECRVVKGFFARKGVRGAMGKEPEKALIDGV